MSEDKMYPISLDQFIERGHFDVDVFIQLTANKFVLFGRMGQKLEPGHLEKYKQKNVQYFFIRANDFSRLADQAITVAGIAIGKKDLATASKIHELEKACNSMFAEIRVNGFDEVALGHANLVALATMNLIGTHPNLAEMVEKFITGSARDERHSLMVSAMASMIGVTMGWTRTSTLERLALGGLLHDIGKLNLPEDIYSKRSEDLTPDELVIFKTHSEFGRETLARMRVIPDDVRLMVYEHHEMADGTGFPRGIKDLFISPFGRVLSLANAFTDLILGMGSRISKDHVERAFRIIEVERPSKFNKDCVKALRLVVGREWKKDAA